VVDFCRTVGSVDNLQRLYVLTYADMRAVGPGVWNNWRDSLLAELFLRTRDFLEKGAVEPEDRAARAARVRARIEGAAPTAARPEVEAFAASMPDSYFLGTPEEMIPPHVDLRRRFGEAEAASDRRAPRSSRGAGAGSRPESRSTTRCRASTRCSTSTPAIGSGSSSPSPTRSTTSGSRSTWPRSPPWSTRCSTCST